MATQAYKFNMFTLVLCCIAYEHIVGSVVSNYIPFFATNLTCSLLVSSMYYPIHHTGRAEPYPGTLLCLKSYPTFLAFISYIHTPSLRVTSLVVNRKYVLLFLPFLYIWPSRQYLRALDRGQMVISYCHLFLLVYLSQYPF